MMRLTIDNSTCKIEGLSVKQHKELTDKLSYQIDAQAAYFSGAYNRKRSLLGKRGEFPTGLLYLVKAYLGANEYNRIDLRKVPKGVLTAIKGKLDLTPYLEQLEAVREALKHSRGIISVPTGCR